jgi:small subunit ribosomal protein S4
MARYTGPKDKISRRFGVALFGPSKALERRAFPPGQHGVRAGRRKKSDYAIALGEKQKLRFQFGVLEKQFRLYFAEASRRRGITGEVLCQLLELRLDNVCYRLGLGNTRSAARQVNGKRVDIPSFQCKPGDVVTVQDKPSSQQLGLRYMDLSQAVPLKEWITLDRADMKGNITRVPENEDFDHQVNVQLVVELYSR